MSRHSEYYLSSPSNVAQLELLEMLHPNFVGGPYRLVRNAVAGITVTLETAVQAQFIYCPMRVSSLGARDTLDSGLKIELGDLGEILPREIDAIEAAGGWGIKPTLIYRTYRSDDLTQPVFGPLYLEVVEFSFNKTGALFEAKAPSLNVVKTGRIYTVQEFPMLRGFL